MGSLTAALTSYLDARAHHGDWLVRIEDVDETRSVPGMADHILRTLEAFGFEWDETVLYQSDRKPAYLEQIQGLQLNRLAYPCGCTRAEIADSASHGLEGHIYPGTCRNGLQKKKERSVRIKTHREGIRFHDRVQGEISQTIADEIGDFVIRRADGFAAYQLAVVMDDAEQGINQVVRGADLLLSTPRQIYLQQLINAPRPGYAHSPLLLDSSGLKISKQDKALPVEANNAVNNLLFAYRFLNQDSNGPVPETVEEFFPWAIQHWDISRLKQPIQLTQTKTNE